ncbi:MAG: hypothetical protein P8Z71_13940 [Candidatus Sulfobium sp.]
MNRKMLNVTEANEKIGRKGVVSAFYPVIMLFILLAASVAFAGDAFTWGVVTQSGKSPEMSSGRPLKVTNERPLTVVFSFVVKGDVSKVRFAISRSDRDNGVTLVEDTVRVKGNIATSHLLLNIHRGVPLGRHDLYIEAFDAGKNVKILTGKLPYILLPTGSECMCLVVPSKNKSENTTQGGIEHA